MSKEEIQNTNDNETLAAKLRNALSPHYGLPSVILKLREHPEVLKIVEDMAEHALKNNLRIDAILTAIDSQSDQKASGEFSKLDMERMYLIGLLNRENMDMNTLSKETGKARTKIDLAMNLIHSLSKEQPSVNPERKCMGFTIKDDNWGTIIALYRGETNTIGDYLRSKGLLDWLENNYNAPTKK